MKKRMFLALDISPQHQAQIAHWRQQHLAMPFKAVDEKNLHITLVFLGLIDNRQQQQLISLIDQQRRPIQQALATSLSANQTFALHLTQLGYFGKAKILHLQPTSCPEWLALLNKLLVELSAQCDITITQHAYRPHLTLYRNAKLQAMPELNALYAAPFKSPTILSSFSLYHSDSTPSGVCYQAIRRWPLKA
ncbi:2'-5' RNA ligase [Colwellia chukchiensis]|uniref:RNA 2',3'-cyclic phosphodiesterase n=1 Tax=Colwellia chukchiensis TaxID=641665 RepID=A0A1H7N9Q5_9GAMM|nr:RNA 2',3'-cyclic phosphodiesterase [Colwellia chukchiensis]SEL20366.1 2'-5' RNA ligase [Colwellia chukchiensis]